jgi:hypothetical protein
VAMPGIDSADLCHRRLPSSWKNDSTTTGLSDVSNSDADATASS